MGVLISTRDKSTAHVIKRGNDIRNLGRWTWITVKGKLESKTTIVTTYRPTNHQATAQNQLGAIRKINCVQQPEEFWEEDLSILIKEKSAVGEVIVIGDFNDDLNNEKGKINTFFQEHDMRELLNEKYGAGPPTHAFGSTKIDGIFAANRITIRQGGYGGAQLSPNDHLYPWVDIESRVIVGEEKDDRPPPVLRKATSKIPSVKHAFNASLNKEIERHKLHTKAAALMEVARTHKTLNPTHALEYEKIEMRIRRAVKYADSRCRKARMGKVPFSEKQKNLWAKYSYSK